MFNNFFAILRCYQHYVKTQCAERLNLPQRAVVGGCSLAIVLALLGVWSNSGTAQVRPALLQAGTASTLRPDSINISAKQAKRPSQKVASVDFGSPASNTPGKASGENTAEPSSSKSPSQDPRGAVGASPNVPPIDDEPVNLPPSQLKGSAAFLAKTATATTTAGAPASTAARTATSPGQRRVSPPLFRAPVVARKPAKRTKPAKLVGQPLPEALAEILPGNSLYGHWARPLQSTAIAKIFFAQNGVAYRQFQGEQLEVGQWRLQGKSVLCTFWPEQLLQTSISTKTVNDATLSTTLPYGQVAIDREQHCVRGRLFEEGYIAWQAMTKQRPVRGITVVRLGNMITGFGAVPGGYQPNDRWMLPYAESGKIFGETIARILSF